MALVSNIANEFNVKKIAILNPYLQGGHVQIAETESARRYIEAASNLGITAEMFANSDSLDAFEPDIVVAITYQEGKLSKYPTYVSLNVPPSLIRNEARFVRNILSFDGYLTLSHGMISWLETLCRDHRKHLYYAKAAFSVPKTPYVPCDFKTATAMYMGTNWDGNRHAHFFNALDGSGMLTCYGPEKSWLNYKNGLYGGEIPFDGESVIKQYRKHGIGLCIGHPVFDAEAIANNRLFEVPAASGLVICAENGLAREYYGDAALYMNHHLSQSDYTEQFIAYVDWVRSNPGIAAEMARETNERYNLKLCMEQQVLNLLSLHKVVMKEKYNQVESVSEERITHQNQSSKHRVYLVFPKINEWSETLPLLSDVKNQTHQNLSLCFYEVSENHKSLLHDFFKDGAIKDIKFYEDIISLEKHFNDGNAEKDAWVGLLHPTVRLFRNHIAMLFRQIDPNFTDNITSQVLKPKYLEVSDHYHLPDYIQDVHKIYDENNIRLESAEADAKCPRGVVLFRITKPESLAFKSLLMQEYLPKQFLKKLKVINVEEVTASVNVDGLVAPLNYKPLSRLSAPFGRGVNKELLAYVDHLKETIWQQEKRIKSIYATKSWMVTFPLRKLGCLIDSLIIKSKYLTQFIVNKFQAQKEG